MANARILDLFCGGGGLSLGAALAGFDPALAIDKDASLTAAHTHNFPESTLRLADVEDLAPRDALRQAGLTFSDIAGIVGGPPCQGFSVIGQRNPSDDRNGLLSHFFRFVESIRPSFFLLENVPGLLKSPFHDRLTGHLESVSRTYEVFGPQLLDAGTYGAPTHRVRMLVVGWMTEHHGHVSPDQIAGSQDPATVRQAIGDLPEPLAVSGTDDPEGWQRLGDDAALTEYQRWARSSPPESLAAPETRQLHSDGYVSGFLATEHTERVRRRFADVEPGTRDAVSRFPRLTWDRPCPTLRAGTGPDHGSYQAPRPIHPSNDRVITVREAARLQGFPDWFRFPPTKWHGFRVIGNSVSPLMAQGILKLFSPRREGAAAYSRISRNTGYSR